MIYNNPPAYNVDVTPEVAVRFGAALGTALKRGARVVATRESAAAYRLVKRAIMSGVNSAGVQIVDLRTLNPFDEAPVLASVRKTGRLIVADTGSRSVGFAAEVIARVAEQCLTDLTQPPVRLTLPDVPTPTTRALSNYYYPLVHDLTAAARRLMGRPVRPEPEIKPEAFLDVPDPGFTGPF